MTDPTSPELEQRIRHALGERALLYRATSVPVPPVDERREPTGLTSRWRPMVVGVAAVAAVTALVVAWLVVARPDSESPAPATPSSALPAPVGVGEEVPLEEVETPQSIESSLGEPVELEPGTSPLSLKPGGDPSITVSRQLSFPDGAPNNCVTIEQVTRTAVWGTSGSCLPGGLLQAFFYPEPEASTDAIVYYAWVEVPEGTAYVTFESSLLSAWQRPIQGVVVFPVEGGPVDAISRAHAADGRQLGELPIQASYNGAQYLPGQTPTTEPQSYSVPAGLTLAEECEVIPLSAIGSGDGPTMLVHDHSVGAPIEFDKREYCRQAAALSPDPMGDIVASFTVRDGAVTADYFERVTEVNGGIESATQGAPIPFDEAQRRIAEQRALRDF